ncbi:MAG: hypothetical protein ACC662_00575 [Planctomycetota bacterium]
MSRMVLISSAGLAVVAVLLAASAPTWASTSTELGDALAQHQTVFLVVTQSNAKGTDQAKKIAEEARAKAAGTRVVVLDRALPENKPLVDKYRVLAAPVPLILVIAHNGVPAGGALLRDATPDALIRLIPTPKRAEFLLAVSQKKPVFLIVSRKSMPLQSEVFEAATQALDALQKKANIVTVDLDDKAEQKFVKSMKIDPKTKEPATFVYNASAEQTGFFRGAVQAGKLVEAAKKKAGGCCPSGGGGGSGGGCG